MEGNVKVPDTFLVYVSKINNESVYGNDISGIICFVHGPHKSVLSCDKCAAHCITIFLSFFDSLLVYPGKGQVYGVADD
jgi:hypothetical protein